MRIQSTESAGAAALRSLAIGRICVAPKLAAWSGDERPVNVVANVGRAPLDPVEMR